MIHRKHLMHQGRLAFHIVYSRIRYFVYRCVIFRPINNAWRFVFLERFFILFRSGNIVSNNLFLLACYILDTFSLFVIFIYLFNSFLHTPKWCSGYKISFQLKIILVHNLPYMRTLMSILNRILYISFLNLRTLKCI